MATPARVPPAAQLTHSFSPGISPGIASWNLTCPVTEDKVVVALSARASMTYEPLGRSARTKTKDHSDVPEAIAQFPFATRTSTRVAFVEVPWTRRFRVAMLAPSFGLVIVTVGAEWKIAKVMLTCADEEAAAPFQAVAVMR